MILSNQMRCLLLITINHTRPCIYYRSITLTCVLTESQKCTSVLQTKRVFNKKRYGSCKWWTCTELCEAFTFLMENIYVQFEGMVYQQIVEIPMGTNCAPHIADLFLFCYERDFMSNLHISKQYDLRLIDMFNETSRYLVNIFTIDKPELQTHIPDIYPKELQLNKVIFQTKKLLPLIKI